MRTTHRPPKGANSITRRLQPERLQPERLQPEEQE